jgi:hypothetical protein
MTDRSTELTLELIYNALQHNASNYPAFIAHVDKIDESSISIVLVEGAQKIITIEDA